MRSSPKKGPKLPATWTLKHVEDLLAQGKIRGFKVIGRAPPVGAPGSSAPGRPRASNQKHGNVAVVYNGIRFDSIKERKRYIQLEFLEKIGEIAELERQIPYELNEGGEFSFSYIADFRYRDLKTGLQIVEDAKGFRTREYKKKKRLMLRIHGIQIKET